VFLVVLCGTAAFQMVRALQGTSMISEFLLTPRYIQVPRGVHVGVYKDAFSSGDSVSSDLAIPDTLLLLCMALSCFWFLYHATAVVHNRIKSFASRYLKDRQKALRQAAEAEISGPSRKSSQEVWTAARAAVRLRQLAERAETRGLDKDRLLHMANLRLLQTTNGPPVSSGSLSQLTKPVEPS
jgi:hypothetical protein